MTEFEAAAIAYQNATLAFQQAELELSRSGLELSRAGLWVAAAQVGVGILQAGLIYIGLRLMRRSADHRDNQHEETMLALRALIERTAPRQA